MNNKAIAATSIFTGTALIVTGATGIVKTNAETIEAPSYTEEDFNNDVYNYMVSYPTITEEAARTAVAFEKKDILLITNPDLLYKYTGIYVQQPIDANKIAEITKLLHYSTSLNHSIYMDEGAARLSTEMERNAVLIFNSKQISKDCPQILQEAFDGQKPKDAVGTSFSTLDYLLDLNTRTYLKDKGSMENLIRPSSFIYNKADKEAVKAIEALIDEVNANKGNPEKVNALVEKIMFELQLGSARFISAGANLALRLELTELYMLFARDNNKMQLTDETEDEILNWLTGKTYTNELLSTISTACNYEKPKTKALTD